MTEQDVNILAHYNSEVARGVKHTKAWKAKMKDLQRAWTIERAALNGMPSIVYSPRSPFLLVRDL